MKTNWHGSEFVLLGPLVWHKNVLGCLSFFKPAEPQELNLYELNKNIKHRD